MSKRVVIRNAGQVVADLTNGDLPDATVASGGVPASSWTAAATPTGWSPDGYRGSLIKQGVAHPYIPSELDDWLRERT